MKKFILVEVETNKQTPFRHFSDLINLKHSKSVGKNKIETMPQVLNLFKHSRFNAKFFLNNDGENLVIESFDGSYRSMLNLDFLTEFLENKKVVESWIGCGFVYNQDCSEFVKELTFWYRNVDDQLIYNCLTNELISKDSTNIIVDTFFIFHKSVIGAPIFHLLLNDDLVFNANCSFDNDKFLVEEINYHDGTFKEFLLFPLVSKCFLCDNVIVSPGKEFEIDFYGRSALYDKNFPFETLQLKVKSSFEFCKKSTGKYRFFMEECTQGYIYARINSKFGLEAEKSTTLRVAYSVHKR